MQSAGLGLCRNRHGNQFHTRIHIPKDLAPMLGRAEVRLSLGTEVRRYAIAAARLVHSRKITVFDEMRSVMDNENTSPTPEKQEEARKRLLQAIQQRRSTEPFPGPQEDAHYVQEADARSQQDAQIVAMDEVVEEERFAVFTRARRLHEIIGSPDPGYEALKLTQQQQISVDELIRLRVGMADAERGAQAKEYELTQTKSMLQDALKRGGQPDDLPEVRISELMAAYRDAPEFTKNGARTNSQYVAEVERFIRAMGDMFIKDISGKTMRDFLDIEEELPPNINKVKRYEGMSLSEISQLNANEDGETVELKTAVQRVTRIGTVFNWALDEDEEKWGFSRGRNPCAKFEKKWLSKEEETILADGEHTRRALSDQDLRKLFTGQVIETTGRKQTGYGYGAKRFKRRYQYWLPMMALFTGARANELAQLRLSDIKDDQSVPFLDINEDADSDGERRKSLKTKTSKRTVPIHSKLIELGFLDYVKEIRGAGHWCLFQEMQPQKATGERPVYSSQMTNWFFRYRKACDVLKNEDGKPVFHSFRHTAATRLENADVPLHRLSGVLGHLQDGESLQTYAKLDKAKVRDELEKMVFPPDVMAALPKWKEVEFIEPQPEPVALETAPVTVKKGRSKKQPAA